MVSYFFSYLISPNLHEVLHQPTPQQWFDVFRLGRPESKSQAESSRRVCRLLSQSSFEVLDCLFPLSQQEAESAEVEAGGGV